MVEVHYTPKGTGDEDFLSSIGSPRSEKDYMSSIGDDGGLTSADEFMSCTSDIDDEEERPPNIVSDDESVGVYMLLLYRIYSIFRNK